MQGNWKQPAIMHLTPELVLPLSEAGSGNAKKFKIEGLRNGWVTAQRNWPSVTKDTGDGDPKLATKEKGAAFFHAAVEHISNFFVELHDSKLDDMYE